MNLKSSFLLFVLLFITGALSDRLAGQDQDITFDRIWQFAEWYSNDDNPVIQSMVLSGRVQYEYGQVVEPEAHSVRRGMGAIPPIHLTS